MENIVLHCDMDRFYCTVEEKHKPELRELPFAVCGDPEMRHSIVMSANNIARRFGVKAGLRFADARQLCPYLKYVTADYNKYLVETKAAREVYLKYADKIIPYGLDESWIMLENGASWHVATQIAELIKLEIWYSLGLSASIGVSFNLIFSKIGSDYKKPNGLTVITKDDYKEKVWPLNAEDLLFVGEVRKKTLNGHGIKTIGDIANADPEFLARILKSKAGYDLWRFANGDDRNFHPENDNIASIGNTVTPPKDLKNNGEVKAVIYMLASAVCARLKKHGLKARCVSINFRDNKFNSFTRQCTLSQATDSIIGVFSRAYELFVNNYSWANNLRSIGVRAANLDDSTQMSLIDIDDYNEQSAILDLDCQLKRMAACFGKLKIENAGALARW